MLRGVGSNRCLDVPSRATANGPAADLRLQRRLMKAMNYLPNGELQVYGAKCLDAPATPPPQARG